jgi:hypothetical protein
MQEYLEEMGNEVQYHLRVQEAQMEVSIHFILHWSSWVDMHIYIHASYIHKYTFCGNQILVKVTTECGISHKNTKYTELIQYKRIVRIVHKYSDVTLIHCMHQLIGYASFSNIIFINRTKGMCIYISS